MDRKRLDRRMMVGRLSLWPILARRALGGWNSGPDGRTAEMVCGTHYAGEIHGSSS